MTEVPDTVDDAIDLAGESPSTDEVFFETLPFSSREIAAAAVARGGGGNGGSQPFETVNRHVTSAEILTLHTSPVQLVDAPGTGKVIHPVNGLLVYRFGTTPYAVAGGNTNFQLTTPLASLDGFASLLEIAGAQYCLEGGSDAVSAWAPNAIADIASGFGGDWTLARWENQPLVFYFQDSVDPTDGDGTIDLYVEYQIWDLP